MTDIATWNDEFNIGVEVVDKAHRKLFSIVRRLLKLTEEDKKDQWACIEGIKYFKNYTFKHFAEEEEYMRSIDYSGYPMHKRLHDNLRDKTLPLLEQEMEESNYSTESIEQFLGFCIGWLTQHIMIEDKAITGKVTSKWISNQMETVNMVLERSLIQVSEKIFCVKAQVLSRYYGGESFGKTVNYRISYISPKNQKVWVILSLEEKLLLKSIGRIMGLDLEKVDGTILSAAKQMCQQILRSISSFFGITDGAYQQQKDTLISADSMRRVFETRCPEYSLLFHTELGHFAFCADDR